MSYIILTAREAEAVRGETTIGHVLDPVLLADGATYVLPARVLDDPAHATKQTTLATKPQRDVSDVEFASYVAPEPALPETVVLNLSADEISEITAALDGKASASLAAKIDWSRSVFQG